MSDLAYDDFLSQIYDDAPYFGQQRSRCLAEFNQPYFQNLTPEDRILELGSGTGMLTVDMARAGFRLDSLDISPAMHRVVTEKLKNESEETRRNVNQIVGDATTYRGGEPYDAIVMAEGLVIALPDASLQRSLFENCHRNLRPGGRILTDFFQPRYKVIYHGALTEHTRFRTKNGDPYMLTIHFENDAHSQIQTWHTVFRKMIGGKLDAEVVKATVQFRYVYKSEVELLMERSGFRIIEFNTQFADGYGFFLIAERT